MTSEITTSPAMIAWQNARAGAINLLDGQQIGDLIDDYGEEWVTAAIREANAARTRGLVSIRFVEVILQRWKAEGFRAPFKPASKGKGGWFSDAESSGLIER